jgi:predicted dehydrogenase
MMSNKINVGIVGCGYWGPNLLRNLCNLSDCEVKVICDLDIKRLNHLKALYPSVGISTSFEEVVSR